MLSRFNPRLGPSPYRFGQLTRIVTKQRHLLSYRKLCAIQNLHESLDAFVTNRRRLVHRKCSDPVQPGPTGRCSATRARSRGDPLGKPPQAKRRLAAVGPAEQARRICHQTAIGRNRDGGGAGLAPDRITVTICPAATPRRAASASARRCQRRPAITAPRPRSRARQRQERRAFRPPALSTQGGAPRPSASPSASVCHQPPHIARLDPAVHHHPRPAVPAALACKCRKRPGHRRRRVAAQKDDAARADLVQGQRHPVRPAPGAGGKAVMHLGAAAPPPSARRAPPAAGSRRPRPDRTGTPGRSRRSASNADRRKAQLVPCVFTARAAVPGCRLTPSGTAQRMVLPAGIHLHRPPLEGNPVAPAHESRRRVTRDRRQRRSQPRQPGRFRHRVVIDEGHHVARRPRQPGIARGRDVGLVEDHQLHRQAQRPHPAASRRIGHHDQFERG